MPDTLQIPHPPDHSYVLIAVAGERFEKIPGFLESDKGKFKVIDRVELLRGEPIPTILSVLSTGQFLTSEDVFKVYTKSKSVNFFLCQKIS